MMGNLPGHVGTWKPIQEIQQILRELGMRQTIYAPAFKGPDPVTFTAEVKAKIFQVYPQHLLQDAGIHAEPSHRTRCLWCWAIHC